MLCGDDDCTVLTSPDCNPVRRHPRFQNLYTYIPKKLWRGGEIKWPTGRLPSYLRIKERVAGRPSGEKTPANCPLQGDVAFHYAWRLRHDACYGSLADFFFIYVSILFFLSFCMLVDSLSLDYFKCRKKKIDCFYPRFDNNHYFRYLLFCCYKYINISL